VTDLAAVPDSDPKKDGFQFFAQRWKKLAEKKAATGPAAKPATPSTTVPAPAPDEAAKKEPAKESKPAAAPDKPAAISEKADEPKTDAEKKSP
jgi:hypothetical protein